MKDKYKTIVVLILLLSVVNILQTHKIDKLQDKIVQQEQVIVELQEDVERLNEVVTELNIIIK